jgi:hypothetical protein
MIVTRLGVSISPLPVLSVEFQRGKELFVWRVEIRNTKPVADIVLDLKAQFPQYLSKVPISQLHRLVKFGLKLAVSDDFNQLSNSELSAVKSKMNNSFEKHRISRDSKDFVYDYRIDFDPPVGEGNNNNPFDHDDSPLSTSVKSR